MRIAFDHQIFGWQKYGGVSRYLFELANNIALAEQDKVAIISPLYINSYLSMASSELQVMGRKVPAIRHTGRIYRAINQWLAPSMIQSFKPHIVHETYYSTKRLAPKTCKIVLTVYDMIHERFPAYFSSLDPLRKEKAVAVARADHIICISEHTRQDVIQMLGVSPEKTSVVHLGFSLTKTGNSNFEHPSRPYLLYVGVRGGYKNFEALLRAYAQRISLKHELDLVAFGGGNFSAKERALIQNLGLTEIQVRHISGDDSVLATLYKGAELFVYPSLYEGFGIPPLEAMSFDCPVACSDRSSIPEVVGNAASFFNPESTDAIADTIVSILNDANLQQTLILRGREQILRFSWQRCAVQTTEVYRKLLS